MSDESPRARAQTYSAIAAGAHVALGSPLLGISIGDNAPEWLTPFGWAVIIGAVGHAGLWVVMHALREDVRGEAPDPAVEPAAPEPPKPDPGPSLQTKAHAEYSALYWKLDSFYANRMEATIDEIGEFLDIPTVQRPDYLNFPAGAWPR